MKEQSQSTAGAGTADKRWPQHACPKCGTAMEPIGGEAYACRKCGHSTCAQPMSGKQEQEWTVENLGKVIGLSGTAITIEFADLICAAHNAALAAERKHSAFCSKMANGRLEKIAQLQLDIGEIRRQHQQEAEEWTTDEELRSQLAEAQAAIRKLNSMRESQGFAGLAINDTSALDAAKVEAYSAGNTAAFESKYVRSLEAIAVAQQPLVEALIALRDGPQRLSEWACKVIDAALAKMKEGK